MSEERVFLRGVSSAQYALSEQRVDRLAAPRVVRTPKQQHVGESEHGDSEVRWLLSPGDEPYLTQTIQSHFVRIYPGGSNGGHGHQNEAMFYILEGRGYEIHDGKRYDWEQGDVVLVHTDCVHQHFNADPDRDALTLVFKAKALWMMMDLTQQGKNLVPGPEYGPPQDWAQLWTPGVDNLKKVIKRDETPWEWTPDGRVRHILNADIPARIFTVDAWLHELPAGGRGGKRWQMPDMAFYVISGRGYDLHWQVEAEIGEQYHARIAKEPTRWEWQAGDLVWIPQNTVHQHFNADPANPAVLLCAQNRLFRHMGYDRVAYLETAPEYQAQQPAAAGAR
jgi:quercetin dioxygenase-like cupin family protein